MKNSKKSHILKLFLISLFFFITPLLSPSLRQPYLYILLNLFIIALGAEAGLLSFLKHQDDKKSSLEFTARVVTEPYQKKEADAVVVSNDTPELVGKKVEKSVSQKVVSVIKVNALKKCPSTPSMFFIGGGEAEEFEEEEEKEDGSFLSGQELFTKSENFIGNFYKQLKIQREDSWRKINDLYHKAF